MAGQRQHRGLTLIEVVIAVGTACALAALVMPSMQAHVAKQRRSDAIAALSRIELAQEAFFARNGGYAAQLHQLEGAAASASGEGLYALALQKSSQGGYTAAAISTSTRPRADEDPCRTMTLTVDARGVKHGPSLTCWYR